MTGSGLGDRQAWRDVVAPLVVSQLLSILGWASATAIVRHFRGPDQFPASTHGVFGWVSWDGGFYRLITDQGYAASSHESLRFFPLYPMLARLLRIPLAGNTDLALVVAVLGVYRVVLLEGGNRHVARCAVWVLLLFPGAFVLSWAYAEALFVALAVWCLWALRTRRFALAALLALAAGLCRPIGVALAVAALIEAARARRAVSWRGWLARGSAVVAAPLGSLAFLTYSGVRGSGFWAPVTIQDAFRHPQDPFSRIASLPGDLAGANAFTAGLHVPFVVAFLVLLGITFRRLPASYGAMTAVVLGAALSAKNLNSIERYAMSAFPLSIAAAMLVSQDERLESSTYVIGGALTISLCTLALCGVYVP